MGETTGVSQREHRGPRAFSCISKQYGRQILFVDASFQLNPGEKVRLVGPSGSGKTTLFRVIVDHQRPLGMEALVVGDPMFPRVMVSIVVNAARIPGINEEAALAFERFLLEPATQARIRTFRHHGLAAQTWWPAGRNNAGSELTQF